MPAFASFLTRWARFTALVLVGLLLLWLAAWKGWIFPSDRQYVPRQPDPMAIAVPAGYRVELLASGLNAPSSLEVTSDGTIFIGESGYGGAYAATTGYEGATEGRILKLNRDGTFTAVAGNFRAPLAGFFHQKDGTLYASHNGIITVISPAGRRDILSGLPSWGDHKNNNITMGPDGRIYVAQGTATNSGIVGLDNWVLWTRFVPGPRDIPCKPITLRGVNVTTADPRSVIPFMRVSTGAYSPFGHKSTPGQVIAGELPCNGSIMRLKPDGSELELVAWGLRNPFDIRFGRDGQLYATDNGLDDRGSRPAEGDDLFHRIQPGAWYGWPDYWDGTPVSEVAPEGGREKPQPLLAQAPDTPARAFARLGEHVAANGFDFAPASFGMEGQAFIARWGSGFPATNQNPALAGFDIARLDLATRKVEVFARNIKPGPASLYAGPGGFERPAVVRFGPDGAMYVLDWGHMAVTRKGPYHIPYGGVLWRISREGATTVPYQYSPPVLMGSTGSSIKTSPALAAGCLVGAGWLVWRRRRGTERT